MNTNQSNREKIVRARHRAAQAVPLLTIAAAGLAATLALLWVAHPAFAPVENWRRLCIVWLAGVAATVIGAAILWRARRRTLLGSAAEMDALLASQNRLETATALQSAADPMARAQRAETERFLQRSRLVPRRRWLPPALGALVALLAAAHLATLVCWTRPVHAVLTAKKNAPVAATEKQNAAPAPPSASIEWVSPESETAATAIEEVPLEAEAASTAGLRDAVLQVEVNGEPRLSQALADDLTQPGRHTLKPSLHLDELNVKVYDILSYHISAKRVAAGGLPPTTSPVQFVQVKPVREDTFICAGGDQPGKCFNYVTALKAAQLRLMKDNFTLAHAEVDRGSDDWRQENTRVGDAQNQLAARAGDVIQLMTTNGYPEQILGLVRESQPLMTDAGGKIQRKENQPALVPQGQALGHLTEVEKYLQNSIKLAGASTQPKAADPFQRPKNLELKTHPLTRAGKIDALAGQEARLAGDLAAGITNSTANLAAADASPGAEKISGTPGQRQTGIKQGIEGFLDDPGFDPEALKHLQASDVFAGTSLERIDRQDFNAAGEPAAEAARELRQTAEALRAGGDQAAKNLLADALLQLSAAAGDVRQAAQAKSDEDAAAELKKSGDAVQQAAKQLAGEAQRQQDAGATNAAPRLDEMARLLQGDSLRQMLAQSQQSPRDAARNDALAKRLDDLAQRAGQLRNPGPLTRPEVARLVERLQRTQANLNNLSSKCNGPAAGQGAGNTSQAQDNTPGTVSIQGGSGGTHVPPNSFAASDRQVPASSRQVPDARGPELSPAEMQRAEAAQLLDDVRLGVMDSRSATPGSSDLAELDALLRGASNRADTDLHQFALLVTGINPPLTGLINSLQTQLAAMRRPYQLAEGAASPAPPAYRAAVSDYFEQVSRDYQPAKAGDGKGE